MNTTPILRILRELHPVDSRSGVTLEALRIMAMVPKAHLTFVLKPYDHGYALWFDLKRNFGQQAAGWLIAEKSKKVRIFAKAETAFIVARDLGLSELRIDLSSAILTRHTP